ncbi:hypothetical protein DFH06DRAFT_173188 [Mycena polygramma]|nr:hypothetical protein DFH06DRAFT_173188 [Mycena polygramma]
MNAFEENASLRESCRTLEEQVAFSETALVEARAKYKEEKKEKLALQETCRELIQLVETLRGKPKDADSREEEDDENETTGDSERSLKQEPNESDAIPGHAVATAKSYGEYMARLPTPTAPLRPSRSKLAPVFTSAKDLHSYFSNTPSVSYPACLLRRTKQIPGGNFVAFAPDHRYNSALGGWTKGSDLAKFCGSSREVFMDFKREIAYMGRFLCIDLTEIHPRKRPKVSNKCAPSRIQVCSPTEPRGPNPTMLPQWRCRGPWDGIAVRGLQQRLIRNFA